MHIQIKKHNRARSERVPSIRASRGIRVCGRVHQPGSSWHTTPLGFYVGFLTYPRSVINFIFSPCPLSGEVRAGLKIPSFY